MAFYGAGGHSVDDVVSFDFADCRAAVRREAHLAHGCQKLHSTELCLCVETFGIAFLGFCPFFAIKATRHREKDSGRKACKLAHLVPGVLHVASREEHEPLRSQRISGRAFSTLRTFTQFVHPSARAVKSA